MSAQRIAQSDPLYAVAGLPVHALVVHAAVILLPLAALGFLGMVIVPRWRERYGTLAFLVLVAATVSAFIAKASGESLANHIGLPRAHAEWGDRLPIAAAFLTIIAGAWLWVGRRARSRSVDGSTDTNGRAGLGLGLLTGAVALAVVGLTVLTGHTGAQAVWDGRLPSASTTASSSVTTPTPTTGTTSSASSSATDSSSTSSSASPLAYTLADVRQHNSASSCWSAINGKVYDLTQWIDRHPGGAQRILSICGQDGSSAFNDQHGGQGRPEAELAAFLLGPLAD